jgi:NTE family protein
MMGLSRHATRRPRTALVLGAGGIKTVAHVGLFKVLRRAGIPIDLVVGSSGGALFGGAFAIGADPDALERSLPRFWRRELFRDYGYAQLLKMFSPRLLRFDEQFGIIKGESVRRLLGRLFGRTRFDELPIPLRVVATDLQNGEAVVLSSGSVAEAIRASIAIPVLFPPYRVDGRWLLDGAVCAPLPIEHAIAEGAEVIIAMGFPSSLHSRIDGPLRLVTQLMRISGNRLYRAELAYHARNPNVEVVPVEVACAPQIGMRDVHEIPNLVALGEAAAEESLPYIRRTLETFHSPHNRAKRRLRLSVRRALRTSVAELPEYGT